ncbi:MAG TPA: tetratricopeptide repeat protein [Terriglobia bacterium]|nr:tetratricopeptide repeat protein [Terriglobia bacterium]
MMQTGPKRATLFLGLALLAGAVRAEAQSAPAASANAAISQAKALIEQGKNDEAISLLGEVAKTAPQTPGLEANLGKAYYGKHDYQQAVTHLEAALKQKPDDGESTQLLGLTYFELGHLQQGIPLLEKVQSWLPRPDVTGSYVLGVSYLQTQQYDKARLAFAKMFSVTPDTPQAHLVLGQMMLRQDLEEEAVPELQKALALDPKLPMAHFLLGEIYLFKSQVQPALDEFTKELEIDPILWLAYWRRGDAYSRLGKWDAAERALKQAVWLNQNFTGPYILLGKVEISKGDPKLGSEFLERALRMDPNNVSAHYLLGTAYRALGQKAEAEHEFELSRTLRGKAEPQ